MIFMARAKRLRVVLKPAFYVLDANGQRVQIPGKTIEFMNGRYATEDPEVVAMLLKHEYCGSAFASVENEAEWKAAHPEYFKSVPEMITGAVATINSASSPLLDATRSHIPAMPTKPTHDPVVNLEDMISKKISEALGPVLEKLSSIPSVPEAKPKKVFTCPVPGCGEVFRSGVELGAHKKEKHVSV